MYELIVSRRRIPEEFVGVSNMSWRGRFEMLGYSMSSVKMDAIIRLLVLTGLVHAAYLAPLPAKEESVIFFGEDFHILLPPGAPDVVFHPTVGAARGELVLMKAGVVQGPRAKLNHQLSHFILENVGETDEGLYTVTSQDPDDNSTMTKSFTLTVRDCSNEHSVKFGENFDIQLAGVTGPISLEFRPIDVEANQTSRPALSIINQDGYENRLVVSESKVTLKSVSSSDEGSYTIVDGSGKVQKKVCLNVKELQNFYVVPYGGTFKFNLVQNSSLVRLVYKPNYDHRARVILEKGELMIPEELDLQDRFFVDGNLCVLEGVNSRDAGEFHVVDLSGSPIAKHYLEVEAFKLRPLLVTIIALVSLVVLMLLVCLLACLVKIRKRAEKSRAIEKIAKNAGQDEGEAFRQVVKDACKQVDDTTVQSLKEDITEKSQSTEVSIKGLEVSSKEVTAFDKNLETSDSGVGFNTTALPLDSDTEAPTAPLHDDVLSTSVASEAKPAPTLTPEPKPAPPPTPEPKASPPPQPKPAPPPTPEPKASPPPEPKPALTPTPDPKPALTPEPKSPAPKSPAPKSPAPEPKAAAPEVKPASTPPPEPKAAMTPPPEAKPAVSPTPPKSPAPEPKPSPTAAKAADEKPAAAPPADAKPPASPSPDHKPATPEAKPPASPEPKATLKPAPEAKPAVSPVLEPKAPTPDPKPALSPTPDPKPAVSPAAEPTTNGTPEPKADSGSESPKTAPPKSPETGMSLKAPPPADVSSGGAVEAITNDSAPPATEEAATT
ncbi:formin-like protein 5 isoform X1 [Alosa alosa]|uniref:formin-like protein 5 isoform X1 n=1 Tax=Alosa alosa TaxID=278164 RepID=UPI0020151715|nr:formin-like protein 5 isoform X1 [Alosa alosa]